ncbi:AMIN domain-containing protein, partial [Microcoleus sp. herbarium7]|uniref:AMIN domain-containing protein n=1 Tax=Microcoleus sp. herbarium7 TaxID=3055435 RepID=UPI002FD49254
MKLSLPFVCVALLGAGIMPVTAAVPRSFSDDTNLDRTEAQRARSPDPSLVNPSTQDDRTQWWTIANALPSQQSIAEKNPSQSDELALNLPVENEDEQLNSDSTVASSNDRQIPNQSPNIEPTAAQPSVPTASIPKLDEIEIPNTNVEGLLQRSTPRNTNYSDVRISQSVVQVTGVRLNPTANGLEVILETPSGQVLQVETRIEGKSAIADIENAQLALPSGGEFRESNPDEGIASVTVTQLEGASRIRVSVTGIKAAPEASV